MFKNKAYTLKILYLDPVSQSHNSSPPTPRPSRQQMFSHSWIHPPRGISYFCKLTHVLTSPLHQSAFSVLCSVLGCFFNISLDIISSQNMNHLLLIFCNCVVFHWEMYCNLFRQAPFYGHLTHFQSFAVLY